MISTRWRTGLALNPRGAAQMVADCNRGSGTWMSKNAGQLQFGPVATTKVLCPPGSLSERYLAQFEWVRSYVLEGGHPYLATMADGSIIEFEPIGGVPQAAPCRASFPYPAGWRLAMESLASTIPQ